MIAAAAPAPLSARWSPLRPHAQQQAYYREAARFVVVPAGRRSGKTENAKRRLVRRAVRGSAFDAPRYFAAAPTREQAKRIFWHDLKRMVPPAALRGVPSESELSIPLWHGGEIVVVGLDKPERMEGAPWDGGVIDEIANVKPGAWGENIRPALSDRRAWCDLIGVPEGRNHYYDLYEQARTRQGDGVWATYTWTSDTVLPEEEIAEAQRTLDPLTFEQEYRASFVSFMGRAYYAFEDGNKRPVRHLYDPARPLILTLDFNVSPGTAAVAQELEIEGRWCTCILGEVWIPDNSNTPAVVRRLLVDWGAHPGPVHVYGDAAGGARGTAQVAGSDWDLVKAMLRQGDPQASIRGFGARVQFSVKPANPAERARVNAVNSRCCTAAGVRWLFVDPVHAPHVVRDFEGVRLLQGGSGEIDKKATPMLTHLTDGIGYYLDYRFPIARTGATMSALAA